jgi:hypothetical protein
MLMLSFRKTIKVKLTLVIKSTNSLSYIKFLYFFWVCKCIHVTYCCDVINYYIGAIIIHEFYKYVCRITLELHFKNYIVAEFQFPGHFLQK